MYFSCIPAYQCYAVLWSYRPYQGYAVVSGALFLLPLCFRVDEGDHLHPSAPRVFLINCFSLIESTMQGHPTLQGRSAQVGTALEAQIASLVGLEAGRVLAACSLGDMVERVRWYAQEGHAGGGALSSDAALALTDVAAGLNALFARVSDMHTLSDMDNIQVCWLICLSAG